MAGHFIAEGLHYYVTSRVMTDDVSLALTRCELVTLIDPDGVRKSTLLYLLTGFLKPATGRYVLVSKPLKEWPTQMLSRYQAVMCQRTRLGFDWPVEVAIAMSRAPWIQRPEPGFIAQVMEMTGCTPLAGRQYVVLSGGEQQRVQSARTLTQLWYNGTPCGWLFLDEPTSALGLHHQQHPLRMLEMLTTSGESHVCIMFHDLNLAVSWTDRMVLLHNDRLASQGIPGTVLQADGLKRWYGAQVYVGQRPANASSQVFPAP